MKHTLMHILFLTILLVSIFPPAMAQDGDEVKVFNFELEKLLNLGSGLLAATLATITFISYQRSRKKRLLYVTAAFMMFAVKSFLLGAEIFFGEWLWVDYASSIADFGILTSFFFGIIKK